MTWWVDFPALTDEEKAHVENTLLRVFSAEMGPNFWMLTNTLLKELGWPQRRMPELRGYLDKSTVAGSDLAKAKGVKAFDIFVSRRIVSLSAGKQGLDDL